MGAWQIETYGCGRTASAAFDAAVQADADDGDHDLEGARGFVAVDLPARTTASQVINHLADASYGTPAATAKATAWLADRFGVARARSMQQAWDDKWSPVIAFRLRGAERARARSWCRVPAGSHADAFLFSGYVPT